MLGKERPESSLLNMQCHMGVHFYVKRRKKKKKAYNKTHSYPALKDNFYWLPNPLPSSLSKQGHWNNFSADHSASHCTPWKKTSESPSVQGEARVWPPHHLTMALASTVQRTASGAPLSHLLDRILGLGEALGQPSCSTALSSLQQQAPSPSGSSHTTAHTWRSD